MPALTAWPSGFAADKARSPGTRHRARRGQDGQRARLGRMAWPSAWGDLDDPRGTDFGPAGGNLPAVGVHLSEAETKVLDDASDLLPVYGCSASTSAAGPSMRADSMDMEYPAG
jgi:hypothetical protein